MAGNANPNGANRAGRCYASNLTPEVVARNGREPIIADPKPGRAELLASALTRRFPHLTPRPVSITAQEAVALSAPEDTQVLMVDTVEALRETLALCRDRRRAVFHILGRGTGGSQGTRIALQGTLAPGDDESARRTFLLLDTFGDMAHEASSRALTVPDALSAAVLAPMRELATRQTLLHLAEKDRDPLDLTRGSLTTVLGAAVYPLLPVECKPNDHYRHHKQLALETVDLLPKKHLDSSGVAPSAVVAVVERTDARIWLMSVVCTRSGSRMVQGMVVFQRPLPRTILSGPASASNAASTIFTD